MNTLLKGAALDKGIKSFKNAYIRSGTLGHAACVSAIMHAAEHGDPSKLNTIYGFLRTNDKQTLRQYVSRLHAIIGGWNGIETVAQVLMQDYKSKGALIGYTTKDGFIVLTVEDNENALDNRKVALEFADEMLDPDGEKWAMIFERNNFAEIKTLGDEQLQKALDTLIKTAKGEKKNTETAVSPTYIDALVAAQKVIGKPPAKVVELN